jgi:hypothetical protein
MSAVDLFGIAEFRIRDESSEVRDSVSTWPDAPSYYSASN